MSQRFSYVRYDETAMAKQQELREVFERLEALVDSIPDSSHDVRRAKALTHTHLEVAYMWTGKAIRDEQIARLGTVDEQPERNAE